MEPRSMRSQFPRIVGGRCKGLWSSLHGETHSMSIQEERMKEKINPAEESLGGSLAIQKDAQFVRVGATSCSGTGLLLSYPLPLECRASKCSAYSLKQKRGLKRGWSQGSQHSLGIELLLTSHCCFSSVRLPLALCSPQCSEMATGNSGPCLTSSAAAVDW